MLIGADAGGTDDCVVVESVILGRFDSAFGPS
jgi:hypothetical protein